MANRRRLGSGFARNLDVVLLGNDFCSLDDADTSQNISEQEEDSDCFTNSEKTSTSSSNDESDGEGASRWKKWLKRNAKKRKPQKDVEAVELGEIGLAEVQSTTNATLGPLRGQKDSKSNDAENVSLPGVAEGQEGNQLSNEDTASKDFDSIDFIDTDSPEPRASGDSSPAKLPYFPSFDIGDSYPTNTSPSNFSMQSPEHDDSGAPLLSRSTRESPSRSKDRGRGDADGVPQPSSPQNDTANVANGTPPTSISKPPPHPAPSHGPPVPPPPPPPPPPLPPLPSKDRPQTSNNQNVTSKPSDQHSLEETGAPVENVDEGDYISSTGAAPHSRLPTDITATLGDGGAYGNIEPVYHYTRVTRRTRKKNKFAICCDCGSSSSSEDEGQQHPATQPIGSKPLGPMLNADILRRAIDDGTNLYEITRALNQWLPLSEGDNYNPMLQAALKNDIQVCKLLKDEAKLKIADPHDYFCDCYLDRSDTLNHALYRVNAYRAMTSSAYLLTRKDPIKSALQLRQKLFTMAKEDKEFKSEYLELTQKCETFAWEMLDLVRGRDELSLILDKSAGGCSELGRVRRVMDEGVKKFVAHPYVQRHLNLAFYGANPNLRRRLLTTNNFLKTIFIVLALPVWILLFLTYILFGAFETLEKKSKFIKWNNAFLRTPCIKFYTQSLSYFTFLLILTMYFLPDDKANVAHATDFRWSEYAIFIYVIGYFWAEMKQLHQQGTRYLHSAFNILDILLITFYFASFVSRIVSIVKTRQAALGVNQNTTDAYTYYYKKGRFEWEPDDPEIISDALFALANIISFSRLVYILPTFESVGPLLVVLGKMITDVFRFAALLLIVFIAFTVGLHNHYHFYAGQTLPDGSQTNSAFHGFFNTFRTLMWSIFGLGDSSSVEIHMKHEFVEIVGFIMVAIFHIVIVIMLINMLIAMMTISFEVINNDADIEWKAARTRLWLEYIGEGSTLPIPFNLIPSPKWLFYLLTCKKCKGPSRKKREEKDRKRRTFDKKYRDIMENLRRRYRKKAEDEQKTDVVIPTQKTKPTVNGTVG